MRSLHSLYNQLGIEQLGACIVRLRHEDRTAKCRFFVVPGDSPSLLGMMDIEVLRYSEDTV